MADDNIAHYDFGAWGLNASGCFRRSIDAVMLNDNDSCKTNLGTDVEIDFTQVLPQRKGKKSSAVGSALIVRLAYHTQEICWPTGPGQACGEICSFGCKHDQDPA